MARRLLEGVALQLVLCCCAFAAAPLHPAPLNVWVDVPFVMQPKNACGPAAIAMVMQYWHKQPGMQALAAGELAEIARGLQLRNHQEVRASAMLGYFKQHGYRAFAFAGQWSDLQQQIAKGRPLIVALKPAGDDSLHYVVVAGVDDPERVVLLNDPAQRKLLKEDRTQFENEWKATRNWTLLALPAVSAH